MGASGSGRDGLKSWWIGLSAAEPEREGSTTALRASRTDEDTVCSAWKHAANTKDYSDVTAGKGKIKKIDYDQYMDYGNLQGCDEAITFSINTFPNYNDGAYRGHFPLYPTRAALPSSIFRYQMDVPGQGWTSVPLPSTWYDCSSWGEIKRENIAVGAYSTAGAGSQSTINVLVTSATAKTQNFAFDGMEDFDE